MVNIKHNIVYQNVHKCIESRNRNPLAVFCCCPAERKTIRSVVDEARVSVTYNIIISPSLDDNNDNDNDNNDNNIHVEGVC